MAQGVTTLTIMRDLRKNLEIGYEKHLRAIGSKHLAYTIDGYRDGQQTLLTSLVDMGVLRYVEDVGGDDGSGVGGTGR